MPTRSAPPRPRAAPGGIVGRAAAAARRLAPWGFPVLYIGWAWAWWLPLIGSSDSVWAGGNLVRFLVGGASPLLAGLLLAWLTGGVARLRDIGVRLVDVRRVGRWWVVVVAFWPAFDLVLAAVAGALGIVERPLDPAWDRLVDPAWVGLQLALALLFPLVEEVGLRGYWLDRLRARFPTSVAALVNGTAWAVWHAPFVLLPGYYAATTFRPELWWWLPSIVAHTVIFVWVYVHTGRSVLAVLVLHAMMNLTGEVLGLDPALHPVALPLLVVVAGTIIAGWRRAARAPGEPSGGEPSRGDLSRGDPPRPRQHPA